MRLKRYLPISNHAVLTVHLANELILELPRRYGWIVAMASFPLYWVAKFELEHVAVLRRNTQITKSPAEH